MKRRSTFVPIDRQPWWSHPAFLLPILTSTGVISAALLLRISGLVP